MQTPKPQHAFTLLELCLCTGIMAILYLAATPTLQRLQYLCHAHITIQQLELVINYARSLAIAHGQTVTVCPSQNRFHCSSRWQEGVLIIAGAKRYFYRLHVGNNNYLALHQFSPHAQQLQIHLNGMTYNNGHFNYKSLIANDLPQFNLYFNRALRCFVQVGEYTHD